jgi:hypothetical protein
LVITPRSDEIGALSGRREVKGNLVSASVAKCLQVLYTIVDLADQRTIA